MIELDSKWLTALRDTCAGKDDVREYLRGVLFDKENDLLIATNGHCLLSVPVALDAPPNSIVYAIPKGSLGHRCALEDGELIVYDRHNEVQNIHKLIPLESDYPDAAGFVKSAVNTEDDETNAVPLNADYVARIVKCFGKGTPVYIRHHKDRAVISAHEGDGALPDGSLAIIMRVKP